MMRHTRMIAIPHTRAGLIRALAEDGFNVRQISWALGIDRATVRMVLDLEERTAADRDPVCGAACGMG